MTHSRSAAILLAVAAAVLVAASAESAARETLTEASRASYGYKGGNYKNGGYNMKNKGAADYNADQNVQGRNANAGGNIARTLGVDSNKANAFVLGTKIKF